MFKILELICYFGLFIAICIIVKLLMLGRKLNFINVLFVIVFLCQVIIGCFMIPNFFLMGVKNWTGAPDPEGVRPLCSIWQASQTTLSVFMGFLNTGMIFIR